MNQRLVAALKNVVMAAEYDGPLYHVTYYKHLSSIASKGVTPGVGSSIGQGAGYQGHSTSRVFLTEEAGVSFWYSKAEAFAEHNSDNPLEDELVPVVLRTNFNKSEFEEDGDTLTEDPQGTRDASATAYYTEGSIGSDELELWDGSSWVDLGDGVDPELAMEFEENPDYSEEDPDEGWWGFKSDNPLIP